jgi:hypothetical protein
MRLFGFMQVLFQLLLLTASLALLTLGTFRAAAFETDNFTFPLNTELADLGPFLEAAHTIALEEAVGEVNARIEKALRITDASARTKALERLHRPQALVDALLPKFGFPLFEDTQFERAISGKWGRETYPGKRVSYQNYWMQASTYCPLDVRWLSIVSQSHTVKAFGVYFGTDKIVHFHAVGASYYNKYFGLLKDGLPEKEAWQKVTKFYASQSLWSERSLFGSVLTGVYSNGDMAANTAGFKFFMNLTEKVALKGQDREPLVVRCGVFWRLNQHVRIGSGWFAPFISDHWNEALNPSQFDICRRFLVRRFLRSHAERIVRFYTDQDGRPNDPAYFVNLASELSTYYGEPYGHSRDVEHLLNLGNTCFPALK